MKEGKSSSRGSLPARQRSRIRETGVEKVAKAKRTTAVDRRKQPMDRRSGGVSSKTTASRRSRPQVGSSAQRIGRGSSSSKGTRSSYRQGPTAMRTRASPENAAAKVNCEEEREGEMKDQSATQERAAASDVSEQSKSRFKAMLMNAHSRGDGQIMHTDEDGERHAIGNLNLGDNQEEQVSAPLAENTVREVEVEKFVGSSKATEVSSAEDAKENEVETVAGHFDKLAGTGRSLGASSVGNAANSNFPTSSDGSNGMRDVLARAAAARMARLKRFQGGATGAGSHDGSAGTSVKIGGSESSSKSTGNLVEGSLGTVKNQGLPLSDNNSDVPSKTATRFARRKVTASFRGSGRALAN